jgi:phosphoglycerate dehydrogenase-like enzyme
MSGAILLSETVEARHAAELSRLAPGRPRVVLRGERPEGDPEQVEIAFFSGDLYPARTRHLVKAMAPAVERGRLRWLHTFSAGVDHPWFQRLLADGVRVTTSAGASAVPIAQTVLLYLLALSRDLPGWLRDQEARRWNPRDVSDLQGMRLGVVGVGAIGAEVARLAAAFGMDVVGVRRRPRGDEPCPVRPLAELDALLPRLDALVLALPLNASSERLLSRDRIGRMKPGAWLVNVGRGGLVDEVALADALASGRLGGAGLDVFQEEPLPATSPLWGLAHVIVTPHSAGTNPGNDRRAETIFLENLARFDRGEALANEVAAEGAPSAAGP